MVYLATNSRNGKRYIGQTSKTLDQRRKNHEKNARGGRRSRFYSALRKHGADAFQWRVLDPTRNKAESDAMEIFCIRFYETRNPSYGYNLTAGGEGMSNPSDETRRRMSDAHKGHTQNRGRRFSGQIRENMIARLQGSTGNLGHHHSPEAKAKMRAAKLGKQHTPEHIERIRQSLLARANS